MAVCLLCMAGNPVLATAGSGDVLTGIVTAFACAMPPTAAAAAGVYVHALAGDAWRARTGSDRGLFAGELGDEVPRVLALLRATQPVSRRF
jgi:NAD(P)H-hydrate repair Nnr-like enzyme with NAD(P)H-hydrate dehydratase domain